MWIRALRPLRSQIHRPVPFSRGYNGQQLEGTHKTYFQPPPPRPGRGWRLFRTIILGTTCVGAGAFAQSWYSDQPFMVSLTGLNGEEESIELTQRFGQMMETAEQDAAARYVPTMTVEQALESLRRKATIYVNPNVITHVCSFPSNLPCEDTEMSGIWPHFEDPAKNWNIWAIYDGHAGLRTAETLKEYMHLILGVEMLKSNCLDRPYIPNDQHVVRIIKNAFMTMDMMIVEGARRLAQTGGTDLSRSISMIADAFSGSCALVSLFDPVRSILRVANTGDSRAVLGRWDGEAGKYVAVAMSEDQTGFNQQEVNRLNREHPNEESVDLKTGRVHGLAVTRAFGDARWKLPNGISQVLQMKFWGPTPRPDGMIKTPPYLTAEPEVMETKVQTGQHPDFLIMASDGLWDNISSADAVTCVQQWLERYEPNKPSFKSLQAVFDAVSSIYSRRNGSQHDPTGSSSPDIATEDDTYWDDNERCMKWRVSPEHFVVEDENCGVHLIHNALGGKRRDLFRGVMTVQPPLSRNVRDDITVQIVFFGDGSEVIDTKRQMAARGVEA